MSTRPKGQTLPEASLRADWDAWESADGRSLYEAVRVKDGG